MASVKEAALEDIRRVGEAMGFTAENMKEIKKRLERYRPRKPKGGVSA